MVAGGKIKKDWPRQPIYVFHLHWPHMQGRPYTYRHHRGGQGFEALRTYTQRRQAGGDNYCNAGSCCEPSCPKIGISEAVLTEWSHAGNNPLTRELRSAGKPCAYTPHCSETMLLHSLVRGTIGWHARQILQLTPQYRQGLAWGHQ